MTWYAAPARQRRATYTGQWEDIPTLNLTFLGADADDPFVVFSWGTPCVLATLDCMANNDRIVGMYEYC